MAFGKHIGKHAKHAKVYTTIVEHDEDVVGVASASSDGLEAASAEIEAAEETAEAVVEEVAEAVVEETETVAAAAVETTADTAEAIEDVVDAAVEETVAEAVEVVKPAAEELAAEVDEAGEHAKRALEIPEIGGVPAIEPIGEGESAADGEDIAGFTPAFDMESEEKKSPKVLKGIGIALGAFVAIVAIVYVAGIAVFSNWFLPNTTIGPIDVSMKSSDEAAQLIDEYVKDYKLDVVGGTFSYRVDADKLGLTANSRTIVEDVHENLEAWRWPVLLWEGAHDESGCIKVTYLESASAIAVRSAVATYNEGATEPQNACVVYDEKKDVFVVQPEVAGTQYEPEQVVKALDAGVRGLAKKAQLGNEQLVQPTVLATDQRLSKAATDASKMISAHLKLSLAGISGGEVGPDQLHGLVSIDENFNVNLDEDALAAWVDEFSEGYNTVGTERTYTRPDGKVITVEGGAYGWEVDTEALCWEIMEGVKEGANKQIEVPCSMIGTSWNGVGEVDWGNRYIDVDLSEQYVRFYDDNAEIIWESDCITGAPDGMHNTVEGVWYVTAKESPSKLVGWEYGKKIYETTVRWWMPFEGNGIGFHDADWQPAFGGYMYASGYGSHGCVNLPVWAAEELWYIIEVDDVVIVHW